MNLSDYVEIVSTEDRVFHFRFKGFWSDEVMAQIETPFITMFAEAIDKMNGQKFIGLGDVREFRTPSPRAKAAIAQTMKYAQEHNLMKAVEIVPSALTRMAVREAAQHTGSEDFRIVVGSVEEAWKKVNELKESL